MVPSIQFKVDIHSVGSPGNQIFGRGVNPAYPTGGSEHAFVHDHIARRTRTEKLLIRPLPAMVIFKVVVNLAEPTILVGCSQRPKKRSWIIS